MSSKVGERSLIISDMKERKCRSHFQDDNDEEVDSSMLPKHWLSGLKRLSSSGEYVDRDVPLLSKEFCRLSYHRGVWPELPWVVTICYRGSGCTIAQKTRADPMPSRRHTEATFRAFSLSHARNLVPRPVSRLCIALLTFPVFYNP